MWDIASTKTLAPAAWALVAVAVLASCAEPSAPVVGSAETPVAGSPAGLIARTRLSIDGTRLRINGTITYPHQAAEGLLMNVRMANSVFEDLGRPAFDPSANTQEFVDRMREYVGLGARAFTISLQGGNPGYEGAVNSAFSSNGVLKPGYMARVARVIERADALGAVIILSLFYQRQDQRLADEQAIRQGVVHAVGSITRCCARTPAWRGSSVWPRTVTPPCRSRPATSAAARPPPGWLRPPISSWSTSIR